jgi:hypothetical protein
MGQKQARLARHHPWLAPPEQLRKDPKQAQLAPHHPLPAHQMDHWLLAEQWALSPELTAWFRYLALVA